MEQLQVFESLAFGKLRILELDNVMRETAYKVGLRQSEFIRFLISERYVYRGVDRKLKIIDSKSKGLLVVKNSNQILVTPKGVETFRLMVDIWGLKNE